MGFLKEFFQKKLQDAQESLEVSQRVRSEYSLPQLRAQNGGKAGSEEE